MTQTTEPVTAPPVASVPSGRRRVLTMSSVASPVRFGWVTARRGRRPRDTRTGGRNPSRSACPRENCRTPLNPCDPTTVQRCRGARHASS